MRETKHMGYSAIAKEFLYNAGKSQAYIRMVLL